jgi:Tripartite tricarboxylate transporter family receptor
MPGKISFASSGVGSSIHMSGELFKAMAKIDMLHVPYRGIAAGGLSDLITGVVHVAFDNLPSSIELIRSGKCNSTHRSAALSSVCSAVRLRRISRLRPVWRKLPSLRGKSPRARGFADFLPAIFSTSDFFGETPSQKNPRYWSHINQGSQTRKRLHRPAPPPRNRSSMLRSAYPPGGTPRFP